MHSVDCTDCAEEIALPLFTAHCSRKKVEPSLQSLRSKQLETRCRKQEYDYFDLTVSLAVSTLSFLKMYLATTAIFDLATANCVVCHATLNWRKAIENSKCKSIYALPFGAATCAAKERQPQMPVAKSRQAYIFPLMYSEILPKVSVFSARNPAPPCFECIKVPSTVTSKFPVVPLSASASSLIFPAFTSSGKAFPIARNAALACFL
jgi:hypothetical protein